VFEAIIVAIDDGKITVLKVQIEKRVLIAELAWARLYTKDMHKELCEISTIIRKCHLTPAGLEMKESAETLHDQLQRANRTVGKLSDQVRNRPEQSTGEKF
jgi:hypothetical protein